MREAALAHSSATADKKKARQMWKSGRASVKKDALILPRKAQEAIFAFGAVAACYAVLVIVGALLRNGVI